jgi:hypothetical protein
VTYATPPVMPAPKFRPTVAEHDHAAGRHVLAAVIADAFDDRDRAAVADREAIAARRRRRRARRPSRRTACRCRPSRRGRPADARGRRRE